MKTISSLSSWPLVFFSGLPFGAYFNPDRPSSTDIGSVLNAKSFLGRLAESFRKDGFVKSSSARQKAAEAATRNAAVIQRTYPCLRFPIGCKGRS